MTATSPRERPLVLASTSRYRRALLDRLGVPFEVAAPDFQEEDAPALALDELVVYLARAKAQSLSTRFPEALIIGADQIPELDGAMLLKPGTPEAARAQLTRLAGRRHRLLTAVALHEPRSGRTRTALDVHHMTMRPLSDDRIRRYVAHDEPLDCAGSYKVEARGVTLFSAMEGRDHTAIVGLPLTIVVTLLEEFGVTL